MTAVLEFVPPSPPPAPLDFPEARTAFLDYLDAYRGYSQHTVKAYARDLRWFEEFLAARFPQVASPGEVQREMVVQYAVGLHDQAPLTIRRKLATLASFYGYLQDVGEVTVHPARKLPLPKVAQACPPYLTEEQVRRLLDAAHTPWHRALVVLLLFGGLRRSELAAVTLEDVDLERGQLLINGKGAKQRVVPLTAMVGEALRARLAAPQSPVTTVWNLWPVQ